MLAEPNVLAINGKPASFLAGGEFPFPMVQGGAAVGAVTIAFAEYGMRINFLPVITPRGTIRLQVAPEVSALDYANAVTFRDSPFRRCPRAACRPRWNWRAARASSSPACSTTDDGNVQQDSGAGRHSAAGEAVPDRAARSKNNSELLVIVTPEMVRPIPAGQPVRTLNIRSRF